MRPDVARARELLELGQFFTLLNCMSILEVFETVDCEHDFTIFLFDFLYALSAQRSPIWFSNPALLQVQFHSLVSNKQRKNKSVTYLYPPQVELHKIIT